MIDKFDFIEYDIQVVTPPTKYTNKAKLRVRCISCRRVIEITLERYIRRRQAGSWSCKKCVLAVLYRDPIYQNGFRQLHSRPWYRSRVHTAAVRAKISSTLKRVWAERWEILSANRKTKKFRDRISRWARKKWAERRAAS